MSHNIKHSEIKLYNYVDVEVNIFPMFLFLLISAILKKLEKV